MSGAKQPTSVTLSELRQEMAQIAEIAGCMFACVRHREGGGAGFDGVAPNVNADEAGLLVKLAERAQETAESQYLEGYFAVAVCPDVSFIFFHPSIHARFPALSQWVLRHINMWRNLQRSQLLLEAMSDGAMLLNEQWEVLACTQTAAAFLGLAPNAIEGQPCHRFFPNLPNALESLEAISGYLHTSVTTLEYSLCHALTHPGQGKRYLLKLKLLRRQQSIEARQHERLSILRHDLRSPLAALKGLIAVFDEEPDLPPEERSHLIELLGQEADRTLAWTEDFVLLLQLKMTPPQPPFPRLTLGRALESMTNSFIAHAHSRQIALNFHLAAGVSRYTVDADAPAFEAFARNCVGHFLRLADRGASISLQMDAHGFVLHGEGPGLFAQPLFEPFSALPRTTASGKRTPGVGLSLILAKRVADLHGWHMRAQNMTGPDGVPGLEVSLKWEAQPPVTGA